MLTFETDLQLALMGTEEDMTETTRTKLEKRSKILKEHAAQLREAVLQLEDQIAGAKAK